MCFDTVCMYFILIVCSFVFIFMISIWFSNHALSVYIFLSSHGRRSMTDSKTHLPIMGCHDLWDMSFNRKTGIAINPWLTRNWWQLWWHKSKEQAALAMIYGWCGIKQYMYSLYTQSQPRVLSHENEKYSGQYSLVPRPNFPLTLT